MRLYPQNKTARVSIIALLALFVATALRIEDPSIFGDARNLTFDTFQRIKPREPITSGIRIIDIDERSIERFGQWPWPRTVIARMIERLRKLGVATVAFDVVFSEPDRTGPAGMVRQLNESGQAGADILKSMLRQMPDNDAILADQISTMPVVLGFFPSTDSQRFDVARRAGFAYAGDRDPVTMLRPYPGAVSNLQSFEENAAGVGSLSVAFGESGDAIRRVPLLFTDGQSLFPPFSLEALRVALQSPSYTVITSTGSTERTELASDVHQFVSVRISGTPYNVPVGGDGTLRVYFSKEQEDRYLSAVDLLTQPAEKLAPLLEGHIVFVGASAIGLRDIRRNALGETVPGVSIHAQIVEQVLSDTFLSRPDWATGLEIVITLFLTIALIIALPFMGALAAGIFGGVLAAGVAAGSWMAFANHGLLIDPLYPMLTTAFVFVLATLLLFAISERDKKFVRSAFQKYLAPDLLKQLEEAPERLKLGGEIKELTLMFMDIRGFTPISEKLDPEELVTFLNELLTPLSEVILENEGAIDKYIGDSIMAFWNAPLDVDKHPEKALRAGLKMIEAVNRMNAEDRFGFQKNNLGLGDVQIGIGINTGEGCVGNMGSSSRFDYSVIGDTVNTASRIESSCKAVGWPLLASGATVQQCPGFAVLEGGAISLKGKSEPAVLYAVIGDETIAASDEFKAIQARHKTLMAALHSGNETEFEKQRINCIAEAPEDYAEFYKNLSMATVESTNKKKAG